MTQTAFNRSGVLSPEERKEVARKCLGIIEENIDSLSEKEKSFTAHMYDNLERGYGVSERQLAWLRDIKDKVL